MDEGRRGPAVMPGVPDEAFAGRGEHRWGVAGAGAQLESQLVPVIGQVADLEEKCDDVERKQDDAGAHQTHEEVELEVGLLPVGPRKSDIN